MLSPVRLASSQAVRLFCHSLPKLVSANTGVAPLPKAAWETQSVARGPLRSYVISALLFTTGASAPETCVRQNRAVVNNSPGAQGDDR